MMYNAPEKSLFLKTFYVSRQVIVGHNIFLYDGRCYIIFVGVGVVVFVVVVVVIVIVICTCSRCVGIFSVD